MMDAAGLPERDLLRTRFEDVDSLPNNFVVGPYASFEVSAVPLPGTLWLFGSVLVGFGFIHRNRKTQEIH